MVCLLDDEGNEVDGCQSRWRVRVRCAGGSERASRSAECAAFSHSILCRPSPVGIILEVAWDTDHEDEQEEEEEEEEDEEEDADADADEAERAADAGGALDEEDEAAGVGAGIVATGSAMARAADAEAAVGLTKGATAG